MILIVTILTNFLNTLKWIIAILSSVFFPLETNLFMLVLTISEQFKIELVSYSSVVRFL